MTNAKITNVAWTSLDGFNSSGDGRPTMGGKFKGETASPNAKAFDSISITRPAEMDANESNNVGQNFVGLSGWHGTAFLAVSGNSVGTTKSITMAGASGSAGLKNVNLGDAIVNLGGQNSMGVSGYEVLAGEGLLNTGNSVDVYGRDCGVSGVAVNRPTVRFPYNQIVAGSGDTGILANESYYYSQGHGTKIEKALGQRNLS